VNSTAAETLVPLPLLADPARYRANTIDLMADAEAREYWINVFVNHLPSLRRHAAASEGDTDEAKTRAAAMCDHFAAVLDQLKREPDAYGELTILRICRLRETSLRKFDFADPYRHVKAAENETCLQLLPALLEEIDAIEEGRRLEVLITGVFAGNIFDLGAVDTTALYEAGGIDFHAVRAKIKPRPWVVDDFETLKLHWAAQPWEKAVVFVDNAGADVVLGMIPLIRELLRLGMQIVVTANSQPALNDITHAELGPLIEQVAAFDPVVREARQAGRMPLIGSGNDAPLIDLKGVSPDLAEAADDADLLILEGMGRAVETNFNAHFTCDALKLAMIKEKYLAQTLHAELYDVVCKYEPARGR